MRCVADLEAALPLRLGPARAQRSSSAAARRACSRPRRSSGCSPTIRARLPLEPGCEITLEANPGTFERERFRAFRAAGVTRLSIGVQSFDDALLHALGRVHDAAQARAAVAEASDAFETFNIDLMYALPGQTLAELRGRPRRGAGVRAAAPVGLPPDDRAEHRLRASTRRRLPDDDLAVDDARPHRRAHGRRRPGALRGLGLRAPRPPLPHNLNYWQFGDYLGIGAGAHGKLSFPAPRRAPGALARAGGLHGRRDGGRGDRNEHEVARAELPFEFMLNALRLRDGFELARFAERTGLPLSAIDPAAGGGRAARPGRARPASRAPDASAASTS